MSQVILFQSLGASGSTTFALNIALGIKKIWPEKKIALVSEGKYPNVLSFCAEYVQNKKGESTFSQIDIFEFLTEKKVRKEIILKYDYVLVDLERSAMESVVLFWHQQADICIRVLSFLPTVFHSFSFLCSLPSSVKTYSVLNKNRGIKESRVREICLGKGILINEVFPFQSIPFWKQTFLGIPVVHQKKSRWSQKLLDFIHKEILHA